MADGQCHTVSLVLAAGDRRHGSLFSLLFFLLAIRRPNPLNDLLGQGQGLQQNCWLAWDLCIERMTVELIIDNVDRLMLMRRQLRTHLAWAFVV